MNKEILNRQYLEYTEGNFNCNDISNDISKIHEQCQFVLNDIYFPIPPLSISIQKEAFNWGYKTLRTKTTTKIPSGRGVINIQVKLMFNHEMILMLHRFIIQIRNNPFVYVKNPYIYDSIFGPESFGIKNLFCTVIGFRVSSYNVANSAFEAELDLRYFNYFPYSRNLMFRQELESKPILTEEGFSTYIFPVFGESNNKKGLIYNLKEVKYKLNKKEKGQKTTGIARNLRDFTKKNVKYNITYPEMYPAKSAPYVRYYNYLQVKSLLENFGIDLNSSASEYRKVLNDLDLISLEKGLQENQSTEKIVIGLHSKYFNPYTRNKIIKTMIEKDYSTLFYYNEYQYIQLPGETLKRYRLEIVNGTENIAEEDERIKVINQNKLKIAKWLTAITSNNKNGNEVATDISSKDNSSKKFLPKILSSERNIEYPWAEQDFKFNKRKDESIFYKTDNYYYPITNEGYVLNNEAPDGTSVYKIYNSNYEESNNASFGLFPVFCPINNATILFDNLFEICTVSNSKSSIKIFNIIVPDQPSDILKNTKYIRNKGDLIGFCKEPNLNLEILSGEKNIFSKNIIDSVGKTESGLEKTDKPEDIDFAKLYDLKYIIDDDKLSFQDYFQYIADRGFFVFTDKEYVSNVFFKTNCVIINNNLDVKNNTFSKANPDVFNIINMATNALVSVSAGITNLIASIPILGQEYPTNQFLSSSEPNYQFNYISRTANNVTEKERASLPEQIMILESIRHRLSKNAREYKFIPDGGYFLIDSFMTRLFGSFKEEYIIGYGENNNYFNVRIKKPIAIDSFEERTIESSPGGSYLITRFSETNVYDFETLQEIKTNKSNIKDSFYKQVIENATQYCGRTDGLFDPQVKEVFKNNERILTQSSPGVPLKENLLGTNYALGNWSTKYFTYKNFYGDKFKSRSGQLNETCLSIINSYPVRDILGYTVCKQVLDLLYDFYKYICKKENKGRQAPQIIISSGFDSALTTTRPTISDHFLGSAVDIKVLGRNAREVFLILDLMAELGIIKNPVYPGKKGSTIIGLGIYGRNTSQNVGMSSNGVINGFVHVDLNVKKLIKPIDTSLSGAARQQDINSKLSGASTQLSSYAHGKIRRWSGEENEYAMVDGDGNYVKDWPDTQHYNSYRYSGVDNFDFVALGSRYDFFKELLISFNDEVLNGNLDSLGENDNNGDAEDEKDRGEELNIKTRPLEISKVEKDLELKEDWEDAIESALGEKAYNFLVDTEDYNFQDLIKEAGQNKSQNLSKALNKLTQQGVTGSTEIKTFEVDYKNDPSGRSSDKITEFEKYAKDNNLIYSIVPADDEVDQKTGKPLNPNSFKIYVVNPKHMQNSLSASNNYQQSEMISLIELLCDFEYFASLLLLEPETYLESPTPEEIEKEYNRIKEALYDINVTPSFFSNLEFGSTGVLKYDYLNKLYSFKDSDTVKPHEELFSLRSLANKNKVDSSFVKKYYDNIGWHEVQSAALIIVEVAALVGSAYATGGLSLLSAGLAGGSIVTTSLDLIDEGEDPSVNQGQQSNGLNNIRRVLSYILSSFVEQSNTYSNQTIFKKINERQKEIFTHIYSNIALNDRVTYNSDRDDMIDNLGYADDVDSGINELLSVFIEKNPILLKYVDLASELKSFKTISNLISFDYIKDDESIKKINFAANGLNPKLAKDYLRFLFCFPYGQFIDGDFFLGANEDNRLLSINNLEFDDNFELDNQNIIRKDSIEDYRYRKQSETERFSIEDQVNFIDDDIDETSMLVKKNSFFESRKKELANEANVRIAYCRSILQEICKTLMSFPNFAESMPNLSYPGLEEFDFAYKNAFPDIDLPLDPADFSNNVNINPGFFFYESNYDLNIGNIQDDINVRAKAILNKSVDFTLNLQKGIYTGTKQVFDSKDKVLIKDFILKDQMDGAATTVLLEGGTGDKLKNALVLGENATVAKDQASDVEIKIDYENAPPDGDYTDFYNNESITADNVMSLDAFDIFKNAENPDYLKSIKENLNAKIATVDNAFGSRAGFLIEPAEVLSIYDSADSDNDNKLNKYLGLFSDNQSYLQKEQLSEVLEKSGEYLLKKQQDMKRAYPTFKFYLIEEDSADSDKLFVYDDFYSFNAVKDFTIHKSRKLAADTAVIRLQNISGTLDGTKQGLIRDVDYEIDGSIKEQIESGQEGAFEKIESVILRPGVSCQLRAGYDSNPANLTILLSGKIADVAWSSNGDMCEITVQSFGVELETKKYGLSQEDDIAKLEFHTTHKLLAYMMFRPELKHFGRYKKSRVFQYGEDKDVILTRETFVGNNKSYGWSDSIYDFMTSKWYWVVIASIGVRFGATAILRKIGTSGAVDDVLTKVQPAAKEALDTATSQAAKDAGQKIVNESLEKSIILNAFKKGLSFADDLASNTPYLGSVAKWIFEGGLSIGVTSRTVITQAFDDIVRQAANNAATKVVANEIAEEVITNATRVVSRNGILGYLRAGGEFLARFFQVNTNVAGTAAGRLAQTGSTPQILLNLLGRDAATLSVVTKHFAEKAWYSAYGSALWYGLTLGSMSAAKFVGVAYVAAKIIEESVAFGADKASALWKALKEYVFGEFVPNSLTLSLSPQDDSIYAPHPNRYIKPVADSFDLFVDEVKKFGGNLLTAVWNGISWFDLFGGQPSDEYFYESILKFKTLMMDRRLKAGFGENVYRVENNTVWEIFHEMSLRHPGWVYGARQYGQMMEYRMFFGLPNQRYFANPLNTRTITRLNKIFDLYKNQDLITFEEQKRQVEYLLTSQSYSYMKKNMNPSDDPNKETIVLEACKILLFDEWTKITNKRFVPFRNYHYISSRFNLVANNIIGSNNDVINEVGIMFTDAEGDEEPKLKVRSLRAHENIPSDQIHAKPVRYSNCKGYNAALRYGISELVNSAKEMYRGEIMILGNPDINPYDVCILDDQYTEMFGPIEVESVTHIFNFETGFLTEIKPNALVTANEGVTFPMLNSIIMYDIGRELAETAPSYLKKDKENLRERISSLLEEWMQDVDLFDIPIVGGSSNINLNASKSFSNVGINGKLKIDEDIKNSIIDQIVKMVETGNIEFQSSILNPNANVSGLLNTSGLTTTFTGLAATSFLTLLTKGKGGFATSVFSIMAGISAGSKEYLNYQLKTPGSFLANKLIPGDMLVSQVSDGNLIQVYPLYKNNKPMIYGGYERITPDKSIKNKLGNIFTQLSDAATAFNVMLEEYSDPANLMYSDPSWVAESLFDIGEGLLPFNVPDGTIKGYFCKYDPEQAIQKSLTARK